MSWDPPRAPKPSEGVAGLPAYDPGAAADAGGKGRDGKRAAPATRWTPDTQAASWGSRVGATLLDSLFIIVLATAPILVAGLVFSAEFADLSEPTPQLAGAAALALFVSLLWLLALALLYAPVTMRGDGQTPGKKIVGIRVVRDDGLPMSFGFAMLRELAVKGLLIGMVGGSFFFPVVLNYLWPLWDESDRALHDIIVSSHVVRA